MVNQQNDGFSAFNLLANTFTNIVRLGYQPTDVNDVHNMIERLSGEQWSRRTRNSNVHGPSPGATASDNDEASFKSCISKEEDLQSASELREQQELLPDNIEEEEPEQTQQQQELSEPGVENEQQKEEEPEQTQQQDRSSEPDVEDRQQKSVANSSEQLDHSDEGDKESSESDEGDDSEEQVVEEPEEEQQVHGPEELKGLHDQPEMLRFCNGDRCFVVNDSSKFAPSWSSISYATNMVKGVKTHYHSCLGVYKCPVGDCSVIANPVQPQYQKVKHRLPDRAKGSGVCPIHNKSLVHQPCKAEWRRSVFPPDKYNKNGSTRIEHKGFHVHERPHEKLSNAARSAFAETVKNNKDATPSQLKLGAKDMRRSGDLHPSLSNLGRIAYERRKVKKKLDETNRPFQLKDIVTWEEEVGEKFLTKKCLDSHNACISIQFPYMKLIAKNNRKYANQTDTLEKWINDPKHPNMSVTVTSTYCELLGKQVPVYMSITYGRTAMHYQSHFEGFIKSLEFESFEEFLDGFTGNIR